MFKSSVILILFHLIRSFFCWYSKFHMQVDQIHEKGICGTEVQAAKRQKLDGGLLRKVECDGYN